jgi:hypothetical protein
VSHGCLLKVAGHTHLRQQWEATAQRVPGEAGLGYIFKVVTPMVVCGWLINSIFTCGSAPQAAADGHSSAYAWCAVAGCTERPNCRNHQCNRQCMLTVRRWAYGASDLLAAVLPRPHSPIKCTASQFQHLQPARHITVALGICMIRSLLDH